MKSPYALEIQRVELYAEKRSLSINKRVGYGQDGIVFLTHLPSVIKALKRTDLYEKERDVYQRFQERGIREAAGFSIPTLINTDDELQIVEMTFVSPPFVVDFATAYLDQSPPYENDVDIMSLWEKQRRELFGDDWPSVRTLMSELRGQGVYLADVKPGNVTIRNPD